MVDAAHDAETDAASAWCKLVDEIVLTFAFRCSIPPANFPLPISWQEAVETIVKNAMMREADQRYWRARAKKQKPVLRTWR